MSHVGERLRFDGDGRLAQDVACVSCGYNHRGLRVGQPCPECGHPVGQLTLEQRLRDADPTWLRQLAWGMTALCVYGCLLFAQPVGVLFGRDQFAILIIPMLLLTVAVGIGGYWLVTAREPGVTDRHVLHRNLLRAMAMIWALTAVLSATGLLDPVLGDEAQLLVLGPVWLVLSVATYPYLAGLATRIPDDSLTLQTRACMWGVLITVGLAIVAVAMEGSPVTQGPRTKSLWLSGMTSMAMLCLMIWSLVLAFSYRSQFALASAAAARHQPSTHQPRRQP